MRKGCVYLVGAGPGDPDLLTVKALRLMREADVVVLDRLVSEEIQDLIPAGTSRIFAGKEAGRHHLRQDEINDLLLRLAHSGRRVVRLKGRDPFIFGRGGEEAGHLAHNHVPFEVVLAQHRSLHHRPRQGRRRDRLRLAQAGRRRLHAGHLHGPGDAGSCCRGPDRGRIAGRYAGFGQ